MSEAWEERLMRLWNDDKYRPMTKPALAELVSECIEADRQARKVDVQKAAERIWDDMPGPGGRAECVARFQRIIEESIGERECRWRRNEAHNCWESSCGNGDFLPSPRFGRDYCRCGGRIKPVVWYYKIPIR